MHSKLGFGHVSHDRFNGLVAGTFNNTYQHSYRLCFLSQIQWPNYSHFLKQHSVYILQPVYSKGEGSVLLCIFRKRKPTHCISSCIIQELFPCLSQAVEFSYCFISAVYRLSDLLKDKPKFAWHTKPRQTSFWKFCVLMCYFLLKVIFELQWMIVGR